MTRVIWAFLALCAVVAVSAIVSDLRAWGDEE